MSQNQTDRPTNRRRTTRSTPRRTDQRGPRTGTQDDETDAPTVPDLGSRDGADTGTYRPDPFDRTLMEDAE